MCLIYSRFWDDLFNNWSDVRLDSMIISLVFVCSVRIFCGLVWLRRSGWMKNNGGCLLTQYLSYHFPRFRNCVIFMVAVISDTLTCVR